MSSRIPAFSSIAARDLIRNALRKADYCEASICQLFGVGSVSEAMALGDLVLARKVTPRSALTILLRLFVQGSTLDGREVRQYLGSEETDAFEASGLIWANSEQYQAAVQLVPFGELFVASDLPTRHKEGNDDFVVGPAPVSRVLFELMIRQPARNVLDLGCGSGVLGLLSSATSQRVIATDINPRAIAITRFNAKLNGLENVEAVSGDLFAGVGNELFDRIICNPPFVISPHREYIYRDGGQEICQRIIREAPSKLNAGGFLQMLCNWPEPEDGDWRPRLAAWFEGSPCDVWVLRMQSFQIAKYASIWLSQQFRGQPIPATKFDDWMTHLENLGAKSVGGGLVIMRPAQGRKPWLEIRDAPTCLGAAGESIVRCFDARDTLAHLPSDQALLDLKLRPARLLQQTTFRQIEAHGWAAPRSELCVQEGFRFTAGVDNAAAGIIGLMDGQQTVSAVTSRWANANGLPPEMFLEHLPTALRKLVELGLLEPS